MALGELLNYWAEDSYSVPWNCRTPESRRLRAFNLGDIYSEQGKGKGREASWELLYTALHGTPHILLQKALRAAVSELSWSCAHGIGCLCNCNVKAGVLVNMWSCVLLTFMDIELFTWFLLSHTLSLSYIVNLSAQNKKGCIYFPLTYKWILLLLKTW